MRVAGLTVLERILRERARAGATRAIVRGDASALPPLPAMPLAVELVAPDADVPADAERVRGDALLGHTITDEASRRAAEWAVIQTCRRPYDGPGDRYVGRAFSLRISRVLTRFPITPNQVTLVGIVLGFVAVALAAAGHIRLAGAVLVAQLILDSVDGELARLLFRSSKLGQWLDNVSDDLIDNFYVAALGIALGGPWWTVGLVAAAVRLACAAGMYVTVLAQGHGGDVLAFRYWFERGQSDSAEVFGKLTPLVMVRSLGRRDTYVLVYGALCMAGWPLGALGLGTLIAGSYGVLFTLHLVFSLLRR
jgi:phosphatidylglycerophosphate synthase